MILLHVLLSLTRIINDPNPTYHVLSQPFRTVLLVRIFAETRQIFQDKNSAHAVVKALLQ